ncbi:hypothetical protein P4U43_02925 [Arthrobacter sp. EH-1B-1]|uniref:Serine kinase/phosphatase n=1 Tax=Arthrobacter vasquezii TaxID=2977629 RepID=A0ABT6CRQ9_9MICC|nr:hypothetical protein [Arthrobacter vasquezii]MDF9276738.1 hypothetical protein [Arthrobacter vasquezii]
MTSSNDENTPNLNDVPEPDNEFLPKRIHQGHAGQPERLDDDALAAATEQERVDAGLIDYAPDQVPDAADPLPAEASDEADFAQRGLNEDNDTSS